MRRIRAFPTVASRTFTLAKSKRFNREEKKMEEHVWVGHFIGYDRNWGITFEEKNGMLYLENACFEFMMKNGYPSMVLPIKWRDTATIDVN